MSTYPVREMTPRQRAIHVSLRNLVPVILEGETERAQLEQDLEGMGCVGLLHRSWTIKIEEFMHEFVMIQEKQAERRNIFATTM